MPGAAFREATNGQPTPADRTVTADHRSRVMGASRSESTAAVWPQRPHENRGDKRLVSSDQREEQEGWDSSHATPPSGRTSWGNREGKFFGSSATLRGGFGLIHHGRGWQVGRALISQEAPWGCCRNPPRIFFEVRNVAIRQQLCGRLEVSRSPRERAAADGGKSPGVGVWPDCVEWHFPRPPSKRSHKRAEKEALGRRFLPEAEKHPTRRVGATKP